MDPNVDAFVVDASVAAKWRLQDEDHADVALALLTRFVNGDLALFAPDHIRYEIASTLTSTTLGSKARVQPIVARQAIAQFLALGLRTSATDGLLLAAFPLVSQYRVAFYDALYLALARELGIPMITADRRFYQRTSLLPEVMWIGEYSLMPAYIDNNIALRWVRAGAPTELIPHP